MLKREAGLVAGYAISLIGGVFSLAVYAHVLGAVDYGRLAVYLALVEALQGVLFQWHRLSVVKFWAANEQTGLASYLSTYHWVWLGLACAALVATGIFQFASGKPLNPEWLAVVAMGTGKSAALYAQEIARASGASLRYALGAVCLTIGSSISGVAVFQLTHSIIWILVASTLVFAATSILCGSRIGVSRTGWSFSQQHFSAMLRYGLPLIPVFVATTAMSRLDRPILALYEKPAVVGVYAAAAALISNVIAAACLLVVTPSYPWLLREKERRPNDEYQRIHARIGVLMLGGVLAMSTALYCARTFVLPLMLGRQIGSAAQVYVLPLLGIAIVGALKTHFFDQAYHLFSRTRALMAINLGTLCIAVAALYLGTRWGGLNGLLYGLLLANTLSLLASATFSRSFVNLFALASGLGLLVFISIVSGVAGVFVMYIGGATPDDWLLACVSTGVAMVVFAGGMYSANVGAVRSLMVSRS